MFAAIEMSPEGLVRVTARDWLSRADYPQLVDQLEQFIAKHPSDRCWIELSAFDGVEPGALVDVTRYRVKHCRTIRRCAIVGDWAWSVCMVELARAVFPEAEVKYFERGDHDEASAWLSAPPVVALAVV